MLTLIKSEVNHIVSTLVVKNEDKKPIKEETSTRTIYINPKEEEGNLTEDTLEVPTFCPWRATIATYCPLSVDQLVGYLACEICPYVEEEDCPQMIQAFINKSVMGTIDWLWDLKRHGKYGYYKSFEDFTGQYSKQFEQHVKEESKDEDIEGVNMEEIDGEEYLPFW